MTDVFLSYSREDQATARRFAEGFEGEGLGVWWDQTLRSGENYDQVTEAALREAKAVVVLWSKHSVDSRWVRAEATQADRNGTLMPVMIEECNRPIMFELKHSTDLGHWKGDPNDSAWRAFLDDVRKFIGQSPVQPAAIASRPTVQSNRNILQILAICAVIALLFGAPFWVLHHRAAAPNIPVASAGAPIRLGVLPFTILSSDTDQAYLSEGLAEDIAIQLNQIPALNALGPASTRRFENSKEDPRAIATALGIANVLVGTVRHIEKHWVFTVELIDGRDSTSRWQGRYEDDDVFVLQEKIVKDVAQAVGVVLGVTDYPRIQGGTENVKAYEQFMRARHVWRAGELQGAMLPFLREAVRLDPDYKRAWLTLYLALRNAISFDTGTSVLRLRQERKAAAAQLDKMPSESLLALRYRAFQMVEQHKWAEAVSAAESAIAVAPANEFDSNYTLGLILLCLGRVDASIPYLQRAVEAEPQHAETTAILQGALHAAGRESDARAEAARAKALGVEASFPVSPSWEELRKGYLKRPDGTLEWPFEDMRPPLLIDAQAAREILRRRIADAAAHGGRYNSQIAIYLATALGDWELVANLQRSAFADIPEATLGLFLFWESGIPRTSESFKNFVRDIGLVDYWRKSGNWSDFCKPVGKDDFECH